MCGTIRGITSSSPYGNFNSNTSVPNAVNRDFDYIRAELAGGTKVSRSTSIWGSIYTDIMGRHVGKGFGYSLFAVIKF